MRKVKFDQKTRCKICLKNLIQNAIKLDQVLGRASEKQLRFVAENLERDRDLFQAIEDLEENLQEKSKTQEMKKPPKKVKLAKRSNGEIHAELIKPIDRDEWIEKIWKTEKMESHENAEPVEILYWFKYNGAKNQGLKISKVSHRFMSGLALTLGLN